VQFRPPNYGLSNVHRNLGITLFVLVCWQPLMAWVRPHADPPTKKRFYWARLHSWIGRAALIIAYVQIATGLVLLGSPYPYVVLYVCGVAVTIALFALIQFRWDLVHFERGILGQEVHFFPCWPREDKGPIVFHKSINSDAVSKDPVAHSEKF